MRTAVCFCSTSHYRPHPGHRLTNGAEGIKELQNTAKHPGSKCSCPGLERCEQAPQYSHQEASPFPVGPVCVTEYTKQGGKAALEGSGTFPQLLHPSLPPRDFFFLILVHEQVTRNPSLALEKVQDRSRAEPESSEHCIYLHSRARWLVEHLPRASHWRAAQTQIQAWESVSCAHGI